MKLRIWGVRGSIPAPGPETNRYGGNTSCVSVVGGSGQLFILDMGTGIVNLGNALLRGELEVAGDFAAGAGRATVLLSHAHWDHIQGFPFFAPLFVPGNRFRVLGNADSSERVEGVLEGQMNPNFSPIYTLKNLGAAIEFSAATGGPFSFGSMTIATASNPHGTTTALAFRLEDGGKSIVYASDAGYEGGEPPAESLALYRGADVLVHDSTFAPEDQASRLSRGLSSCVDAARVAVAADARTLLLFHYDQDYTDDDVDALTERCRAEVERLGGRVEVMAGREGLELEV